MAVELTELPKSSDRVLNLEELSIFKIPENSGKNILAGENIELSGKLAGEYAPVDFGNDYMSTWLTDGLIAADTAELLKENNERNEYFTVIYEQYNSLKYYKDNENFDYNPDVVLKYLGMDTETRKQYYADATDISDYYELTFDLKGTVKAAAFMLANETDTNSWWGPRLSARRYAFFGSKTK
jgi:hypothetical protein